MCNNSGAKFKETWKNANRLILYTAILENLCWGEHTMFNGIEIIIGSLGALVGIGGGYLVLSAFFAGIRHITKPGAVEVKETGQKK